MVRNAASMQSLRNQKSDLYVSSSKDEKSATSSAGSSSTAHSLTSDNIHNPTPTKPMPFGTDSQVPLQRLNNRHSLQFLGEDAYTKSLMNRMATGAATAEEIIMFNRNIQSAVQKSDRSSHTSGITPPQPISSWPQPYDAGNNAPRLAPWAQLHPATEARSHLGPYEGWNYQDRQVAALPAVHQAPRGRLPYIPSMEYKEKKPMSVPQAHQKATRSNAAKYTKPFCDFLTDNPTVFHAVAAMKKQLLNAGFKELSERERWSLTPSESYFVERNGSSLIAFTVGGAYKPGNGAAILAGHVDALTARLKPISQVPDKAGYVQLGVAPYAGGMNSTWWDRDLGIGGRVLVKEGGKVVTKLVKLDWPIARIPTLAPHFGAPSVGPFNTETQMVPIIGLESSQSTAKTPDEFEPFSQPPLLGGGSGSVGSFAATQPPGLVKVIAEALGIESSDYGNIVNWELELFDIAPATVGGLNKEFIFAGRIDDKLCSWAALQALIESKDGETEDSSVIKVVGLFDDEEIGSLLRQGARSNFLPITLERAVGSLAKRPGVNLMGRTYANSFLVSSDVTHAVNPNFLNVYLENHAPHLNVGIAVAADPNGNMTTDAISTAIFKACADKVGAPLQVFQIRNDSRSGGTVGPMLSSMTGIRAIDAGLPQLSMHSIRATTGSLDPGLGVITFAAFLNTFEDVDREFYS